MLACTCDALMSNARYLGAVKAEEGVGAVGQEELQSGRLQQEACMVQLGQLHYRPSLMRARRPLLTLRHKRQLSDSLIHHALLKSLRYKVPASLQCQAWRIAHPSELWLWRGRLWTSIPGAAVFGRLRHIPNEVHMQGGEAHGAGDDSLRQHQAACAGVDDLQIRGRVSDLKESESNHHRK